jgi:hypothetical protein
VPTRVESVPPQNRIAASKSQHAPGIDVADDGKVGHLVSPICGTWLQGDRHWGGCTILQKLQVNFGRQMTKRFIERKLDPGGKIGPEHSSRQTHYRTSLDAGTSPLVTMGRRFPPTSPPPQKPRDKRSVPWGSAPENLDA